MQTVGQNQYDSVHEFNIHWPYGFNIRILVWNLKSVIILLKNCRRVEPLFFLHVEPKWFIVFRNSQHLGIDYQCYQ